MTITPLREAQKALTRERLLEAARQLFYSEGYAAVTLDQIATRAGTQRTTLYTHFRDKLDILRSLAEDYALKIAPVFNALPGPVPSRGEIDRWLAAIAAFVAEHQVPTVMFSSFGVQGSAPEPVERLGEVMFQSLAGNLPAFKGINGRGRAQAEAREWARAILRQLSAACVKQPVDEGGRQEFACALAIAGDMLESYLRRRAT